MPAPPLRIALTYNLQTSNTEEQAERLRQDYVDRVADALDRLGHAVVPVEVSGDPPAIFRRILEAEPELVFNLAEGEKGVWREAFYPMLYEFLGLPYTGAGPGVLGMGLDKRLTEEALAVKGVEVPRGRLVTPEEPEVPPELRYPLLIKPNFEGSSMGIHQDSIVRGPDEARERVARLLEEFPDGLDVEEYIEGREVTIGYLAEPERNFTAIVEYRFPHGGEAIMDYETKQAEGSEEAVTTLCPAPLEGLERVAVLDTAARAVCALRLPDLGRVDLRLRDDGKVFLIEVNPLPGLRDMSPLVVGAAEAGMEYDEVIDAIVVSAARRHGLVAKHETVPEATP